MCLPKGRPSQMVLAGQRRISDYLSAILPGLADTPMQCIAELTPTAWAQKTQP